jgi:hypothetical protein
MNAQLGEAEFASTPYFPQIEEIKLETISENSANTLVQHRRLPPARSDR